MTSILLLILLLTVVHASSYENQSTAINTDQNVLVDCSACWPVNSNFNRMSTYMLQTLHRFEHQPSFQQPTLQVGSIPVRWPRSHQRPRFR